MLTPTVKLAIHECAVAQITPCKGLPTAERDTLIAKRNATSANLRSMGIILASGEWASAEARRYFIRCA